MDTKRRIGKQNKMQTTGPFRSGSQQQAKISARKQSQSMGPGGGSSLKSGRQAVNDSLAPTKSIHKRTHPKLSAPPSRPRLADLKKAQRENVFSQVTRTANLKSIMKRGLLADFGGKGGASAAVGKQHFVDESRHKVHLGSRNPIEHTQNNPAEFYRDVYARKGIPSTTLSIALSPKLRQTLQPDPDDTQGGRYRTNQNIPREFIAPMPLERALRQPGAIGADYAPTAFVKHALGPLGNGRDNTQRTEDLRRGVHSSEKTIYTDS